MEGSRALVRCLEQLQISQHGCLRTSRAATTRRLASRLQHRNHLPSSSRAFTTTHAVRRDAPDPADVPSSSGIPAASPAAQADAQPSRRSIDLSTITTNPNYKKPIRPPAELRRDTLESLGSLISSEKARLGESNQGNRQRTPNYADNYATYGRGGSMFNRTTPSRPLVSRGPLDVKGLVDDVRSPDDTLRLTADLKAPELTLRLKPTLGRTVDVDNERGFDLTRAFVNLEAKINGRGNSVRKDERNQKFHVRRGQAKKIKKRERWRVLFKEGFLGECNRVRKMIRQGW